MPVCILWAKKKSDLWNLLCFCCSWLFMINRNIINFFLSSLFLLSPCWHYEIDTNLITIFSRRQCKWNGCWGRKEEDIIKGGSRLSIEPSTTTTFGKQAATDDHSQSRTMSSNELKLDFKFKNHLSKLRTLRTPIYSLIWFISVWLPTHAPLFKFFSFIFFSLCLRPTEIKFC